MKTTFYTMKILGKLTLPFFLLYVGFMSLTGMYSDRGDTTLPEFLMYSFKIFLVFLFICFVIHIVFHLLNHRFRFIKSDRHYTVLRVVSVICFFIPLGGVTILFFILFPLSFQNRKAMR